MDPHRLRLEERLRTQLPASKDSRSIQVPSFSSIATNTSQATTVLPFPSLAFNQAGSFPTSPKPTVPEIPKELSWPSVLDHAVANPATEPKVGQKRRRSTKPDNPTLSPTVKKAAGGVIKKKKAPVTSIVNPITASPAAGVGSPLPLTAASSAGSPPGVNPSPFSAVLDRGLFSGTLLEDSSNSNDPSSVFGGGSRARSPGPSNRRKERDSSNSNHNLTAATSTATATATAATNNSTNSNSNSSSSHATPSFSLATAPSPLQGLIVTTSSSTAIAPPSPSPHPLGALREEVPSSSFDGNPGDDNKIESSSLNDTVTSLRSALQYFVQQTAMMERSSRNDQTLENCARIGSFSLQRTFTFPYQETETWQEGSSFKMIADKLKLIESRKDEIERKRKVGKNERTKLTKLLSSNPSDPRLLQEVEAANQQEEIYRFHLALLKKQETDLLQQRENLNVERDIHIKQLRLKIDEERSRFNDFRSLNNRYQLMNMLGRGGFSEVYQAYDLVALRKVACKIHQYDPMWPKERRESYLRHATREYEIHRCLTHPNVVKLYDIFNIDETCFCTVLESCEDGDLDTLLKSSRTIPERDAKVIMSQIFWALKYLNEQPQPIIHYDLKPGNILFHRGEIKITDFGLSKLITENSSDGMIELTSMGAGTYWYLPPECLDTENPSIPKISSKVDVWSAGVVFYQMLYGQRPFGNNLTQRQLLTQNVIKKDLRVTFPSKPFVSEEAKNFIRTCLEPDQRIRPDAFKMTSDRFLSLSSSKSRSDKQRSIETLRPPSP